MQTIKILYNLKQSSQHWYKRFSDFFLEKLGLACIHIDHNIFIMETDFNNSIVNMFIDDIKVMAPKRSRIIQ